MYALEVWVVVRGRSVPSSYLLVADMDGIKMVSMDGTADKSVYVAAVGRPFFSNLVALTYDSTSDTAYYSDVARYRRRLLSVFFTARRYAIVRQMSSSCVRLSVISQCSSETAER